MSQAFTIRLLTFVISTVAADLDVTDFLHVSLETAQLAERQLDGGKALAELLVQFALQIRWLCVVDYTRLQATSNTAVTAVGSGGKRAQTEL